MVTTPHAASSPEPRMKILHVIVGLETGGAELMLKRLVQAQAGLSEFRHSVVTLTSVGSVGEELRSMGVPVDALGMRGPLGAARATVTLSPPIRAVRPDVVQTWMYHSDLIGGIAARIAGVRAVVWGIRTTDITSAGRTATVAVRAICAKLSAHVPAAIVCAAEAARRAHVASGYNASRMLVIPNGFDLAQMATEPKDVAALRDAYGFGSDTLVVGSLGRRHAAKDHATFLRAAAAVVRQDARARFLLIGRDVDLRDRELAWLVAATRHPERFAFLGQRRDVPVCLGAMDVFCLHSRNEGFPNVLGEAMAMGVPCVATDVGDAAVLLGDSGEVVPKETPDALAAAILRMLSRTDEQRRRVGELGRQRIRQHFTIESAADRFAALYRRLVTPPSSAWVER